MACVRRGFGVWAVINQQKRIREECAARAAAAGADEAEREPWDDSKTDLERYRLTEEEAAARHEAFRSRHAALPGSDDGDDDGGRPSGRRRLRLARRRPRTAEPEPESPSQPREADEPGRLDRAAAPQADRARPETPPAAARSAAPAWSAADGGSDDENDGAAAGNGPVARVRAPSVKFTRVPAGGAGSRAAPPRLTAADLAATLRKLTAGTRSPRSEPPPAGALLKPPVEPLAPRARGPAVAKIANRTFVSSRSTRGPGPPLESPAAADARAAGDGTGRAPSPRPRPPRRRFLTRALAPPSEPQVWNWSGVIGGEAGADGGREPRPLPRPARVADALANDSLSLGVQVRSGGRHRE